MATNQDQPEEVVDSSQYIRTYAKDMAALVGKRQAGTTQPTPTPKPPPPPPPPPRPSLTGDLGNETTDGVTLPQVDESLITLSKKEPEALDLSDSATSGPTSVFEKIQRTPEPTAPAPTAVPLGRSLDAERDAVLARLRAKRESTAGALTPPPAAPPSFTEPPPAPLPSFPPLSKEPPPIPTAPPPPPPPKPEPPKPPARFHTYTTDFSDRIDTKKASAIGVLAAQADRSTRRVATVTREPKKSPLPLIASAVLFLVIGVGAVYGAYRLATRAPVLPVGPAVPSLIAADEKKELTGTSGTDLMRALAEAAAEPLVEGNVLVTYVTTASTTDKGLSLAAPQPGGVLIKALPLLAPDILLRNTANESTVGIVHAGSETRPFFILRVTSFERTFAGMLAWEVDMRRALQLLYPDYPQPMPMAPIEPTATTASSTPAIEPAPVIAPTAFVDAVVRNYDVRVLRDASGQSLILYGYKDKATLIIARDEAAFIELVNRLNAAQ